jgi:uncharacterized membrane protein YbhN (UPF0104 family)
MDDRPTLLTRWLVPLGKAIVSLGLLGLIIARVDFSLLHTHWHRLSGLVLLACAGLLAVQVTLIAGVRLKLVLACLKSEPTLAQTSRVALCGFFFEQVAFGFVGGDAMRLWLLRRIAIPGRTALQALLIDRGLGFAALFLLALAGLPGLRQLLPNFADHRKIVLASGAIVLLAGAMLSGVLLLPERYRRHPLLAELGAFVSGGLRDADVGRRLSMVLALAITVQLLNVLIMFLVGLNMRLPVRLAQWFFIVPAALLFSMLPITAGGWGLREGILVFSLQGLGVRPEEAVVPSIVFGLGTLLVTLPGGLIWLANRRPKVTGTPTGEPEAPSEERRQAAMARAQR